MFCPQRLCRNYLVSLPKTKHCKDIVNDWRDEGINLSRECIHEKFACRERRNLPLLLLHIITIVAIISKTPFVVILYRKRFKQDVWRSCARKTVLCMLLRYIMRIQQSQRLNVRLRQSCLARLMMWKISSPGFSRCGTICQKMVSQTRSSCE